MSGRDWRHGRGYRDRPANAQLEAEVAADVAAYVAGGGRVQQIPMGVSGLDDQGLPVTTKRDDRGRDLTVVTGKIGGRRVSSAAARARMQEARGRPRKPRLADETVRALLQAARRMAVPVRPRASKYTRRSEDAARKRIAAEALAQLDAPYSQIAEALDVYGTGTVASYRKRLLHTEALCARDLVREVQA